MSQYYYENSKILALWLFIAIILNRKNENINLYKGVTNMLSEEYRTLFKNDRLVAYIAENLADFAETEIKEDSLLSVLHRSIDALCDGEYLASIMEYYEYTPEEDQIKAVDQVYDLFERAYHIVEKWNADKADKVDNLTEMVRRQDMPFPCLLDTIYRLNYLCEQNHKI